MKRGDEVWKTAVLSKAYLEGVRGGIPYASDQIAIMMRLVEGLGKPVESFADLGCGDGILAGAILERYPKALGILLDFSEPMLKEAQVKLKDSISNLHFVNADFGLKGWVGSVENFAPFDLIVSGLAIHHQPDNRKRELYREILELLRNGGLFVNVEHVSSSTSWVKSLFDDFYIDSLYAFHKKRGTEKSRDEIANEYYHRPDKAANILASVESQCQWLRECGFVDVDCYFKVFELALFGGRRP